MRKDPSATTCLRAMVAAGMTVLFGLLVGSVPVPAQDGGVVFNDIAAGNQNGITYQRTPTPSRLQLKKDIEAKAAIPNAEFFGVERPNNSPQKAAGVPGLVLFDYDNDGDLDIYVSNGPGSANSLYANQLMESGSVTFVDMGVAAGVDATSQDSTGACAGDIDNDGDADLYVVATGEPNRLFENLGDGTFADITATAGVGGGGRHANSCSFGDIDNDGLLDVVVANSYDDWHHRKPVFAFPMTYPGLEHNYLFRNHGGNFFSNISAASGIENVSNMSRPDLSGAAFSWAVAMLDLDLDGNIDILVGDNQGPPDLGDRSLERGWNRLFRGDGHGNFVDVTEDIGLDVVGSWMGLSFADFDCNGHMDFFATDLGNYLRPGRVDPPILPAPSRWFLQDENGHFSAPGLGPDILGDPFGWGTSTLDYDNDGDSDIVYHGGVDILNLLIADNPGVIFQNTGQCSAEFIWDSSALARDHRTRGVQTVAVGDLNRDGFADIVTAANFQMVFENVLPLPGIFAPPTGGPFDAGAVTEVVWIDLNGDGIQLFLDFLGHVPPLPGDLSVEINSADNGNGWAAIRTMGGAGTLPSGNNRDGIGAVLFFTPDGGPTSMQAVVGGSSYAAQDALEQIFGMGSATSGTLDVLWPGGVRNRLYDVAAGERILMPEIPCSYDGHWRNFGHYNGCVMRALNGYSRSGAINPQERQRILDSAAQAFNDSQ